MSKFTYDMFNNYYDGKIYGIMFNKKKYTKEEAMKVGADELESSIENLDVSVESVRYMINRPEEQGSGYQSCEPNERGSFLCWCVKVKEANNEGSN